MKPAFVSLIIFCGAAFAQVGAPVMGLLADQGAIRAMRGIPAAGNVDLAFASAAFALVEPSPAQTFALATTADTGEVQLVTLSADGSGVQTVPVIGASAAPGKIVFSPNGSTAVLWYSGDQHAEIVSNLPQTPVVTKLNAPSASGAVTNLAVSDDGQWLVLAGASFVDVLGPSGQPISLPSLGVPDAVAFYHGSSTIALHTNLEVVTFADPGGAATRTLVWSNPTPSAPNAQVAVGFGLSADNSHLTITGNLGGVETFDLSTNLGTYVDCSCVPTTLKHLGGTMFRLTGVDNGPVKLYDASTGDILFVPASTVRARRPIMRGPNTSVRTTAEVPGETQP